VTTFDSLLDTLAISVPVRGSDGQGGWTIAYVDAGTAAGRLWAGGASEDEVADNEEARISHRAAVRSLTTSGGYQIARGSLITFDGVTVEVDAVMGRNEPEKDKHHYELACIERQDEKLAELGS
jgi:head-tail adaptor